MISRLSTATLAALLLTLAACAPPADNAEKTEAAAAEAAAQPEPAPAPKPRPRVEEPPAPPPVCHECGVVASIDEHRKKGEGSGFGAVAGAIAGGVIGHQFGGGKGKDAATAGGAILGGVAGHQAEKQIKANTVYKIGVRMDDGGFQTVTVGSPAGLAIGQPVRVIGDDIAPR